MNILSRRTISSVWSIQTLRWSTAVCCRWPYLKPVHVIKKILWKTQSVMVGKIITFWRIKMRIWLIYGILLVNECCGTLSTAVRPILHFFLWETISIHCEVGDFYKTLTSLVDQIQCFGRRYCVRGAFKKYAEKYSITFILAPWSTSS